MEEVMGQYHYRVTWAVRYRKRRENPTRPLMNLRQAITNCNLKVIGWEWSPNFDCNNGPAFPVWFNAQIELKGKTGFIQLVFPGHVTLSEPDWTRALERRRDYVREHDVYYCEVRNSSMTEIEAQLGLWLVTLEKNPKKFVSREDFANARRVTMAHTKYAAKADRK
jgi:hypothetical protein